MNRFASTSRVDRTPLLHSATCRWAIVLFGALTAGVISSRADAQTVYYMQGSGVGANLSTSSGTDQYWKVVAMPAGAGTNSGTVYPPVPFSAIIPRGVPSVWLGGGTAQTGYTTILPSSTNTNYWISTSTNAISALTTTSTHSWIVAQTFNVSASGEYRFDFKAASDNELRFYVGGTVSLADAMFPTIVGGTQIGPQTSGTGLFRNIYQFTGTAPLTVGTGTAYAVVTDWGAFTGVLITESMFVAVPEPSTYAMAVAGIAVAGWRIFRRKKATGLGSKTAACPPPVGDGLA